ncbi:MAG: MMPL family transporter, partial [Solirubrobacterales bacterium]|nr:MMPL family transporter [Solirubrobacterales bacterium]
SGELDVTVTADDPSDPEVIAWMQDLQARVLADGGFDPEETCASGGTDICPAASLSDIVASSGEIPDEREIDSILGLLPPQFAQAVIETDPETGEFGDTAVIAFGIRVMPFDEQAELIDQIRAEIDAEGGPPPGVDAALVGLPVLAADANGELSGNRYLLSGVGLLAVALVLLALYRSPRRALVPLIPIVLATGWAGLVFALAEFVLGGLGILDVALNPMSATLGALVIAIATEFSVLLSSRYHEERGSGLGVAEALRRAYSRTGVAVLASGLTATAGFATLLATDIPMVRDFGLVTVLDLLVSLAGVMIVLPAALVWAERWGAPARHPMRLRRPTRAGSG